MLENKIEIKLVSQGKVSHMDSKESYEIYLSTHEKIENYCRTYAKRNHASYTSKSANRILK